MVLGSSNRKQGAGKPHKQRTFQLLLSRLSRSMVLLVLIRLQCQVGKSV